MIFAGSPAFLSSHPRLQQSGTTPVNGTDVKALGQKWTLLADLTKKNVTDACTKGGIKPDL